MHRERLCISSAGVTGTVQRKVASVAVTVSVYYEDGGMDDTNEVFTGAACDMHLVDRADGRLMVVAVAEGRAKPWLDLMTLPVRTCV